MISIVFTLLLLGLFAYAITLIPIPVNFQRLIQLVILVFALFILARFFGALVVDLRFDRLHWRF